jgi:hypothetical protein
VKLHIASNGTPGGTKLFANGELVDGVARVFWVERDGISVPVLELDDYTTSFLPNPNNHAPADLPRPEMLAQLRKNARAKRTPKSETDPGNGNLGHRPPVGPFRNPDGGGGAAMAAAA